MEWLQTLAHLAGVGVLLVGIAIFIAASTAVYLSLASVSMQPDRSRRAIRAAKELRRLVAALRGKGRNPTA